ncbi:helix-turn-helix domain-containing protein [Rossellomorea sp. SC111]|uniref:helix-turn-helix domain-containing protein n=1 Tax=Rossellomorea sp. SC111 TaxID=2968985 RepID=UPI00215AE0D8|nr:helix-turn-helix domain-containing protein [Rossellomorea sp. SC111]MCR8848371.1 helix-turn-helix domain-containing protein [Rossellomorea sp. SC111]
MIGKKLKEARAEMRISQKQLAGELSLTRSYISMVENGHAVPNQQTLEKIAYILKKPLYYFLEEPADHNEVVGRAYIEKAESLILKDNSAEGLDWLDRLEQLKLDDFLWVKSFLMRIEFWISRERYSEAYHSYLERKFHLEKIKERTLGYEVHMKIAKLYFRMERFKDAISHYQYAVKLVSRLKNFHLAMSQAHTYLGTCYLRIGHIDESLNAYIAAFELAKLEGDDKQLGNISMGIGKAYLLKRDLVKAKIWTEQCFDYFQHQGKDCHMAAMFNLAVVERKIGDLCSSRKKLAICTWYARKNNQEIFSNCLFEIAVCKLHLSQLKQVQFYCRKALESLSISDSTYLRGEIFRLLGAVHLFEGDQELAYFFTQASSDLFRRIPRPIESSFTTNILTKSKSEILEII